MVKTLPFGGLQVPVPGFGAMGISFGLGSNLTLEQAEPVLLKAIELGCTFWDTAVSGLSLSTINSMQTKTKQKGCLPSRCQRKAPRRFHQEAQCPRQSF
jgi:predicted aldo/keto reductase-like oxidoreductase